MAAEVQEQNSDNISLVDVNDFIDFYHDKGWILHPLDGKKPEINNWQHFKKSVPKIEDYIKSGKNLGLVCGEASTVTVLDFDSLLFYDYVFPDGSNTLESQRTNNRKHVFVTYDDKLKTRQNNIIGIDIRNAGGNIVLPPSVHASGDIYRWINPKVPVRSLTDDEIQRINKLYKLSKKVQKKVCQCGSCFETLFHKINDIEKISLGASLSLFSEMKSSGLSYEEIHLLAKLVFKDRYKEKETNDNLQSLTEHPQCDTLREELEPYGIFDCEKCSRGGFKGTPKNFNIIDLSDKIMTDYHFKTAKDSKACYVYQDGLYVNGGIELIESEVVRRLVRKTKRHQISEAINYIKIQSYVNRTEFDKDLDIINVNNGLLNIKTGELQPHTPKYLSSVRIPVTYDPGAKCPQVNKFFDEVVSASDRGLIEEFFGYCLYRIYSIEKAFMLLGDGRNGKSTTLNLLRAFLGANNWSAVSLFQLTSDRFAASSLYDKLANIYPDLPDKAVTDSGMLKMLTGNDALTIQRKHGPLFEFVNYAKMIFSANKLPKTYDDSNAYFSRWIIINFPNSYIGIDADRNLIDKLSTKEELSGLLNLAIAGLKRLLDKRDFTDGTVDEMRERYTRMSDSLAAFVMDCVYEDTDGSIPKQDFFNDYAKYCRDNGYIVKSKDYVYKNLSKHINVSTWHPKIDGKQIHAFKGIRYKWDAPEVNMQLAEIKKDNDGWELS